MPKLLRDLKAFYKKGARKHLPWRSARDPYRILVSEVMLQQTQVDRVVPYYRRFLKRFPTAKTLAEAPLSDVLGAWQGLGYNRRAKYLREAAAALAGAKRKDISVEFLESLPGVGHYTARAVAAFAFDRPEAFVETNIRTVFFHHLKITTKTSDAQLLPLVAQALAQSKMRPRDFYAALMDYGAHLKRQGIRLNSRSKHYAKQSKFKGSARELRGMILRELLKSPATLQQLQKKIPRSAGDMARELGRLSEEEFIRRHGRAYLPVE